MMGVRLRVKEIAEQRGITRYRVQKDTGLDWGLLRRYWTNTGNTGEPIDNVKLVVVGKIAKALGVPPGDLFEATEDTDGGMIADRESE